MANQPDVVLIDKQQKKAVVIDVAIPSDSNIKKKEHEKLEKYQGLKEELEKMWKVRAAVVPVVMGALGAVTPKLGEWLQQIPGKTSEVSVQKSAVLGTAKILRRTDPQTPRPLLEDPSLRMTHTTPPGVRLENNPFIIYLNLLVSNLIQFGCMIIWMAKKDELSILSLTLYYCSVMASLGFRICIILERYAVIFPAQLQGIRQPKSSVLISFIVWGICLAPVAFLYDYVLSIFVFVVFVLAILSIPIMVFCLARTLSSLPAAASVPTEEKRRVVGVLVLLFISYTEMIVSTDVWSVLMNRRFLSYMADFNVIVYSFLLNPFVDLILFVFMCKGPIDKLLAYLSSCSMKNCADKVKEENQEEKS